MDELRRETRPETVDRVIQSVISIRDEPTAIRTYNREKIAKHEITEWLLTHQSSINNITLPKMLTHFINEITHEITSETQRISRMQSIQSQLQRRLQELQQQPVDVEHGGSRRRRRRASKHSNKSRKTKTKSRRH
jgi:hypothetical protein